MLSMANAGNDDMASAILTRWNMDGGEAEDPSKLPQGPDALHGVRKPPNGVDPRQALGAAASVSGHRMTAPEPGDATSSLRSHLNASSQPNLGPGYTAPPGWVATALAPSTTVSDSPQTSADGSIGPEQLRSQSWNPMVGGPEPRASASGLVVLKHPGVIREDEAELGQARPASPFGAEPEPASTSHQLQGGPSSGEPSTLAIGAGAEEGEGEGDDDAPPNLHLPITGSASGTFLSHVVAIDASDHQHGPEAPAGGPVSDAPPDEITFHGAPGERPAFDDTALGSGGAPRVSVSQSSSIHFTLPSQPVGGDDDVSMPLIDFGSGLALGPERTPRHAPHLIGNLADSAMTSTGVGPGIFRLKSNYVNSSTGPSTASRVSQAPRVMGPAGAPLPKEVLNMGGTQVARTSNAAAAQQQQQQQQQSSTQQSGIQPGRKERRGSVYHQVITLFQPFAPKMLLKKLQVYSATVATAALQLHAGPSTPSASSPSMPSDQNRPTPNGNVVREAGMTRSMRVSVDHSLVKARELQGRKSTEGLPTPMSGNRGGPASSSGQASGPSTLRPESEHVHGAMLIIDVSGFTALTEKLSQDEGRMLSGEHLIACLNDYFDKLYGIIEENGGDVIKFAGDAMIVLFDAHGDTEAKLIEAATRSVVTAYRAVAELGEVRMLPTGKVKPVVKEYVLGHANSVIRHDSQRGSRAGNVPVGGQGNSVHGAGLYQSAIDRGAPTSAGPQPNTAGQPRTSRAPEEPTSPSPADGQPQPGHQPATTGPPLRSLVSRNARGNNGRAAEVTAANTWASGLPRGSIIGSVIAGGGQPKSGGGNALGGPATPEINLGMVDDSRALVGTSSAFGPRKDAELELAGKIDESSSGGGSPHAAAKQHRVKEAPTRKTVGIIDKPTAVMSYKVTEDDPNKLQAFDPDVVMPRPDQLGLAPTHSSLDDSLGLKDGGSSGDSRILMGDAAHGGGRTSGGRPRPSKASSGSSIGRFFHGIAASFGRIFSSFSASKGPSSAAYQARHSRSSTAALSSKPGSRNSRQQPSGGGEGDAGLVSANGASGKGEGAMVHLGRKSLPSFGADGFQQVQPFSAGIRGALPRNTVGMPSALANLDSSAPRPMTGLVSGGVSMNAAASAGADPSMLGMDMEEFRLSIKVLCAVGSLYAYHVGYSEAVDNATGTKTSGRWEFFIGDGTKDMEESVEGIRPPMQQLIDLEPFSEKKRVVVSQEVNHLLANHVSTEALGEGKAYLLQGLIDLDRAPRALRAAGEATRIPQLPGAIATSFYLESIKSHVPRCVSASIRDGHREFASEVRYCSCAFFGFPGLLDGAANQVEAVQRIQKAFENVDKAMSIYEGEFMQFRCDEKGFLAVCCFGLMGKTHKDDAMRALHSALSVCHRMEKTGLRSCCGVTTGILLCAFVGSSDRCEYTIFGDAINTSARLMVKSKARTGDFDILCDEVTQRLCAGQARFEEVPGIKLKGKSEGTKVYGVETLLKSNKPNAGEGGDGHRREAATFVGREHIVDQVQHTINDVVGGQSLSDLVVVSGEVGMGKSRLLQHALEATRMLHGDRVICGAVVAESAGSGHVLGPWKRLLRSFVRQMEGKDDEAAGYASEDDDPLDDGQDMHTMTRVEDMTSALHRGREAADPTPMQSGSGAAGPSRLGKKGSGAGALGSNAGAKGESGFASFMSRSVTYGISEERPYDTGAGHMSSGEGLAGDGDGAESAASSRSPSRLARNSAYGNGPGRVSRNGPSDGGRSVLISHSSLKHGDRGGGGDSLEALGKRSSGILRARTQRTLISFAAEEGSESFTSKAEPQAAAAAHQVVSRSQSLSKMAIFRSLSRKSIGESGKQTAAPGLPGVLVGTTSFNFGNNYGASVSREQGLMSDIAEGSAPSFMTRTLQKMHLDRRDFYNWLNVKGNSGNSEGIGASGGNFPLATPSGQGPNAIWGTPSPMQTDSKGKNRKGSVTSQQQRAGLFRSETFQSPGGGGSNLAGPSRKGFGNLRVDIPPAAAPGASTPLADQSMPTPGPPTKTRRNSLLGKQEIVRQISRSNLAAPSVVGRQASITPGAGGPGKRGRSRSINPQSPKSPFDEREDFHLVVNFIKELIAVRGCVVITVDELDRLDSLSVELLNYLLDVIPTGLVAVASISSLALRDLPRHVNDLFRAHGPQVLEMGLMSKEETSRFIDAVLGIEKGTPVAGSLVAGDPTLHEYIFERTHGHPLHTEQLLLLIKQSLDQDVSMEDLNYMLNKSISIAAVILKRIDELRPGAQLTLKVASVLGNRIELSLLQKIHPLVMSEAALQAQLTQLVQMNFLIRDAQEGVYRFSSELVREVCYGLIPVVQRGSIHQSIAFALQEALETQGVDVPSSAIAYHLVKSLTNLDETAQYRARQAIEQLEQAAFEALEQHSFQEALGFLNDMEGILNHPVLAAPSSMFTSQIMTDSLDDMSFKRAIASLGIAEALLGLHSVVEAEDKLEAALELLHHADVLERPTFSFARFFGRKRGRGGRVAPELSRRTGEDDMDIEELQIVVKVLELYLDLRSLLHNELMTDFASFAQPGDDVEILRMDFKREMSKVKMILKNLSSKLRREVSSKRRPLPYDLKERVQLAVGCV